jgi:hypothetical protein
MSLKRTLRTQLSRPAARTRTRVLLLGLGGSAGVLFAGVLLLGLGGSVGCDTYSTFKDAPSNCSVENAYEFDLKNTYAFDTAADGNIFWAPSGDPLCNGNDGGPPRSVSLGVETMADGPRCGSQSALVFRSANCNDWGVLAGVSGFGPKDEHLYEGMSFWARSPGNTGKNFTIVMDDANTTKAGGHCLDPDGGAQGSGTVTITLSTGEVVSGTAGAASQPDWCGNSYTAAVTVTGDWRFYTIPFTTFTQAAQPNRVPNALLTETGGLPGTGLITSALENLIIRLPKESAMELWIDNLSFYKKKGSAANTDAARD